MTIATDGLNYLAEALILAGAFAWGQSSSSWADTHDLPKRWALVRSLLAVLGLKLLIPSALPGGRAFLESLLMPIAIAAALGGLWFPSRENLAALIDRARALQYRLRRRGVEEI